MHASFRGQNSLTIEQEKYECWRVHQVVGRSGSAYYGARTPLRRGLLPLAEADVDSGADSAATGAQRGGDGHRDADAELGR